MFVDTNVLVAVRVASAPGRAAAAASLEGARAEGAVRISRQVVREYLAVVTRPQTWAAPLPMADALEDAARLVGSFQVLEDGPKVAATLAELCTEALVAGKQVHDANIVATMLAYGEDRLLTFNAKDFRRFKHRIRVRVPTLTPPEPPAASTPGARS